MGMTEADYQALGSHIKTVERMQEAIALQIEMIHNLLAEASVRDGADPQLPLNFSYPETTQTGGAE
jgi:hypothetical protein